MGVRLRNTSISLKGTKYTVEVIDTEYSGTVIHYNIQAGGVIFKTNGDSRDIWKPMSLSSCELRLWLDNEDLFDFYNDLAAAEESRFFLKVLRNEDGTPVTEFLGMILVDTVSRNDETYPLMKLDAIDGMAILKEVEYEWTEAWLIRPLWQILHDCINQNPVVQQMYGSNDTVLHMYSNIKIDSALFGTNIFQSVGHVFYYYTLDQDQRTNWDCYRIIEEICKKYMLRITYDNGVWVIRGIETYFSSSILDVSVLVTKGGTVSTAGPIDNFVIDINNMALAGGRYQNLKGYRQVRIEASKEGSNKFLAQNVIHTSDTWTPAYFTAPPIIKNTEIDLHINVSATILWQLSYPQYGLDNKIQHVLKLRVKFTDQENLDVFYGYKLGNIIHEPNSEHVMDYVDTEETTLIFMGATTPGTYSTTVKIKLPPYVKDRKIELAYEFAFYKDYKPFNVDSNLREYYWWLQFNMGASPLGTTNTPIPINAYIEDTKNTGVYEIKIHSSDMYGALGTKALVFDGVSLDLVGDKWRFGNSGAYEGLEKAMSKFMMKYLVHSQEMLTIPISSDFTIFAGINPTGFGTFFYKSKQYFITNVEQNYLEDIILVYGVKINTPTSLPITSNSFAPKPPSTGGESSSNFSNVSILQSVLRPVMREYTVTGTEIDVDDAMFLPVDAKYNSVIESFMIIVDGVVWSVVQAFNPADRRPRASVNIATKKITFNRTLNASIVKVIYTNLIIRDEAYSPI